jgi:hypothetical protein
MASTGGGRCSRRNPAARLRQLLLRLRLLPPRQVRPLRRKPRGSAATNGAPARIPPRARRRITSQNAGPAAPPPPRLPSRPLLPHRQRQHRRHPRLLRPPQRHLRPRHRRRLRLPPSRRQAPQPRRPAPTNTRPKRRQKRAASDTVVWANLDSKIYHFSGYRNYGTTKEGAYMCEKDAVAQAFNAAKNEKHP